jgi:hypothetical protein
MTVDEVKLQFASLARACSVCENGLIAEFIRLQRFTSRLADSLNLLVNVIRLHVRLSLIGYFRPLYAHDNQLARKANNEWESQEETQNGNQ